MHKNYYQAKFFNERKNTEEIRSTLEKKRGYRETKKFSQEYSSQLDKEADNEILKKFSSLGETLQEFVKRMGVEDYEKIHAIERKKLMNKSREVENEILSDNNLK